MFGRSFVCWVGVALLSGSAMMMAGASATLTAQDSAPTDAVATPDAKAKTDAHDAADADHHDADHAAGHSGGHGDEEGGTLLSLDIGSAIWNLIIFLIVLAVLSKFVWPGILDGLKAREDKIRGDLEAAERANLNAQTLLADYKSKLDQAAVQVQSMLAEARRDAEANGQKIVDEAKLEAERQRQRAVADIETATKVAMAELAGSTSDLAMKVARSVVGRELKAEDHADLIRQSLDRLPSQN